MNISLPIPCPACNYDLRGLINADGAKCPECGGEFTHAQIADSRRGVSRAFLWKFLPTPVLMAVVGFLALWIVRGDSGLRAGAVVACGVGFAWLLITERRARVLIADSTSHEQTLVYICAALMALTLTMICAAVAGVLAIVGIAAIACIRYIL